MLFTTRLQSRVPPWPSLGPLTPVIDNHWLKGPKYDYRVYYLDDNQCTQVQEFKTQQV